ncbi:MAG TPA: hypothetical protein VJM33_07485 [Microthrixaceae bacterium]|nr:hypothetical protein [Microthrixaceae bacterium]
MSATRVKGSIVAEGRGLRSRYSGWRAGSTNDASDGACDGSARGQKPFANFVTVTKYPIDESGGGTARHCAWCGRRLAAVTGTAGRPQRYCRRSCRQRMYEARRRSDELGLAEHELVVTKGQLDELRDRVAELDDVAAALIDELEMMLDAIPDAPRRPEALTGELRERLQALLADVGSPEGGAGNPRSVK